MTTPHISNGRVLLQNTTDDLWYYLGVVPIDSEDSTSEPTLALDQTIVTITSSFSTYVVLKADNGDYYKMELVTISGVVTYKLTLLSTPEPVIRLVLKNLTTDEYFRVVLVEPQEDGTVYAGLQSLLTNLITISLPWRSEVSADFQPPRSIISVDFLDKPLITPVDFVAKPSITSVDFVEKSTVLV